MGGITCDGIQNDFQENFTTTVSSAVHNASSVLHTTATSTCYTSTMTCSSPSVCGDTGLHCSMPLQANTTHQVNDCYEYSSSPITANLPNNNAITFPNKNSDPMTTPLSNIDTANISASEILSNQPLTRSSHESQRAVQQPVLLAPKFHYPNVTTLPSLTTVVSTSFQMKQSPIICSNGNSQEQLVYTAAGNQNSSLLDFNETINYCSQVMYGRMAVAKNKIILEAMNRMNKIFDCPKNFFSGHVHLGNWKYADFYDKQPMNLRKVEI